MGQSAILRHLGALQARVEAVEADNHRLRQVNSALGAGLTRVAFLAGCEDDIRRRVASHMAALKQADIDNPANPVPAPASEAPASVMTTDEAIKGDSATPIDPSAPAGGNSEQTLFEPGMVPGSTEDVPPDAVTSVESRRVRALDEVLPPEPAERVDVEAPVAGTEGKQPLDDVRIETEIEAPPAPAGDAVAFPLQGEFATQEKVSSARFVAAMRLAQLRIASGISEHDSDVIETQALIDSNMATEAMQHEISTLEGVRTAASRRPQPEQSRRLVPRTAARNDNAERSGASFQDTTPDGPIDGSHRVGSYAGAPVTADEFMFE